MSRSIFSILLLIVSAIAFFTFVDPMYKEIQVLSAESRQFDDALIRSKELQSVRDSLLSRYNTFSSEDLNRIEKLLPDNVDNVRLILDLDSIASQYGILIKDVSILEENAGTKEIVDVDNPLGKIRLSFKFTAPYAEFKQLIGDLEQSLRIVDIESLSFKPRESNNNLLDFDVIIKTYWLK